MVGTLKAALEGHAEIVQFLLEKGCRRVASGLLGFGLHQRAQLRARHLKVERVKAVPLLGRNLFTDVAYRVIDPRIGARA